MIIEENYRSRLLDDKIAKKLESTGAVLITGMRWTGKTTTGSHHSNSIFSVANPDNNWANKRLAEATPMHVLKGAQPRLIDEWQLVPSIWDCVRDATDNQEGLGHFILTGSSFNSVQREKIFHTGTGRITTVTLSTMSLYESGDSSGSVSLQALFDSDEPLYCDTGSVELEKIVRFCIRGGWPKNIDATMDAALDTPSSYIDTIITSDFNRSPLVKNKRSTSKIDAVLRTLARYESKYVGQQELSREIKNSYGENISRQTLDSYIDVFKELFIIEEQRGYWNPTDFTETRFRRFSKTRFADPSLVIAAMDIKPHTLLDNIDALSLVFNSLCYHDLKIYTEYLGGDLYHFQDEHVGADFLIDLNDGRIGCFDSVVGGAEIDRAANELLKVKKVLENANCKPVVLGVICAMSDKAYTRPDGVVVIPITALKP